MERADAARPPAPERRLIAAHWQPASAAVCALGLLLGALAGAPWPAAATAFEARSFANEVNERRYKSMVEELRCLVCQNQTIAASDADLAKDLRDRVYSMIEQGRSDKEIIDYMVQRYGDFVLYRPPMKPSTILLWAGPFALGAVALVMLLRLIRRGAGARRATAAVALSPAQHQQALDLLGEDSTLRQDGE